LSSRVSYCQDKKSKVSFWANNEIIPTHEFSQIEKENLRAEEKLLKKKEEEEEAKRLELENDIYKKILPEENEESNESFVEIEDIDEDAQDYDSKIKNSKSFIPNFEKKKTGKGMRGKTKSNEEGENETRILKKKK